MLSVLAVPSHAGDSVSTFEGRPSPAPPNAPTSFHRSMFEPPTSDDVSASTSLPTNAPLFQSSSAAPAPTFDVDVDAPLFSSPTKAPPQPAPTFSQG